MALIQDERIGLFRTPLGDNELALVRFDGTEAVGEPFEYRIGALSENRNINFDAAIGKHCTIKFKTYGGERIFDGLLVAAEWVGRRADLFAYRLVLRPWLWLLTHRANCQIFRDKSVKDIILKVFQDAGFQDYALRLTESYPAIEYCVQYRESDFNFVSRLMEHWGIYYFFTHEENKHTLVLADAPSSHRPIPGRATIPYLPLGERSQRDRELLYDWSSERRFRTGHFRLNDYDFKKPNADLVARAQGSEAYEKAHYEAYDYPGNYTERSEGDRFAKILMQAEQALDHRSHAAGDAISLCPGGTFTLDPKPSGANATQFMVLRAAHSFSAEAYRSITGADAGEVYHGSYEFLPKDRPFRSLPVTPKTRVYGPQTAKVVGQEGEEIDVDEHGRIRVLFHWVRDATQSCRVRVAQVWAGKEWGGQFIPRIGQEAVVEFLEGDPDRPLVIGTVYNEVNKHPYALPANKTQSGLKSHSTKGGGGHNEFMFEDKKGSEKIRMHAQKDHEVVVRNNASRTIGNTLVTTVANSETRTVGKEFKTPTGSASYKTTVVKGDYTLDVDAGAIVETAKIKIELKVGPSKITIDPSGITLDAPTITIKAATLCVIQGLPVKIN